MKSIKIVQKFFSKAEATNAASYQRAKAKRENKVVLKVEVIDAYELFKMNNWLKKSPFEKLDTPAPGQFMVIVRYNHNVMPIKKTTTLRKKIIAASNTKTAADIFKIVRLTHSQSQHLKATFNFVSNTTVTGYRFKYRTNTTGKTKSYHIALLLSPVYSYSVAA